MKVKLSIVFILIMLVVSGCGLGENFAGDLGELKAPDTMPPLLEKEGKWSDFAGELKSMVKFLSILGNLGRFKAFNLREILLHQ